MLGRQSLPPIDRKGCHSGWVLMCTSSLGTYYRLTPLQSNRTRGPTCLSFNVCFPWRLVYPVICTPRVPANNANETTPFRKNCLALGPQSLCTRLAMSAHQLPLADSERFAHCHGSSFPSSIAFVFRRPKIRYRLSPYAFAAPLENR